jgi:drug/metabolite transporter (DMT)-like permease
VYLGVVVTGIGYWAYFKAIEKAGTFMASFVFFIKPILAPLASLAVLGTTSTGVSFYAAIVLEILGSTLMLIERKKALKP